VLIQSHQDRLFGFMFRSKFEFLSVADLFVILEVNVESRPQEHQKKVRHSEKPSKRFFLTLWGIPSQFLSEILKTFLE
jgi:hypothetical protein